MVSNNWIECTPWFYYSVSVCEYQAWNLGSKEQDIQQIVPILSESKAQDTKYLI